MIAMKELNRHGHKTNDVIDRNLHTLFVRMNELRDEWGKPMIVTSGLRSDEDQAALIASGKSKAKHSLHLAGAAVDILDRDGSLAAYVMANLSSMARIGLWIENPAYTPGWIHFQIFAPKSLSRVFIP